MTISDKSRDNGEVGVSVVSKNTTATETVHLEELSTSPAIPVSSKPPSVLVRPSGGEKERLLYNEDIMSNILPVAELPPPPGINLQFEINKKPEFDIFH